MYITLSSDTDDYSKTNKTNHFRVQLPTPISLENSIWEVALIDIKYPVSWSTPVKAPEGRVKLECYHRNNILIPLNIRIPSGYYRNVQELTEALQYAIEKKGVQLAILYFKLDLSLYKLQKLYIYDRELYNHFDPNYEFDFKWEDLRNPQNIPKPRESPQRNKINGPLGGPVRTDKAYQEKSRQRVRRQRKRNKSTDTIQQANDDSILKESTPPSPPPPSPPPTPPLLRKRQIEAKERLTVLKANLDYSRNIKKMIKLQKQKHLLSEELKVYYSSVEEKQQHQRGVVIEWNPSSSIKTIKIDHSLQFLFGFDTKRKIAKGINVGNYNIDIRNSVSSFSVHCSLIQFQRVDNSLQQLLRTVSVIPLSTLGNIVYKEFATPHYVEVISRHFDTIDIWIVNDNTGELIDFQFGNIILKLHFRRKALLQAATIHHHHR